MCCRDAMRGQQSGPKVIGDRPPVELDGPVAESQSSTVAFTDSLGDLKEKLDSEIPADAAAPSPAKGKGKVTREDLVVSIPTSVKRCPPPLPSPDHTTHTHRPPYHRECEPSAQAGFCWVPPLFRIIIGRATLGLTGNVDWLSCSRRARQPLLDYELIPQWYFIVAHLTPCGPVSQMSQRVVGL